MIAFCMKKGALQNVNMLTVSKSGRFYIPEKPLSSDLRHLIIDKIVEGGGDPLTMIFPGRFVDIANELNVSLATVSKIWKNYCETGSLSPLKHRGGNPSRLSNGDLELIEVLKRQKPSITHAEVMDCLHDCGDLPFGTTSVTEVCNAVRNRLCIPSGKKFTLKKIAHVAQERFTIANMAYTQLFVDYLYAKDPYTLKYFYECGVKLPSNNTQKYGHAPIRERAIEVTRYAENPNTTVNFLCPLTGVTHMNTVDEAANTLDFLQFFEEAYNALNPVTLRPCLEVGDTIVMDNNIVPRITTKVDGFCKNFLMTSILS